MLSTEERNDVKAACIRAYLAVKKIRKEGGLKQDYLQYLGHAKGRLKEFNKPYDRASQLNYQINYKAMLIDLLHRRDKWPRDKAGFWANVLVHPTNSSI